MAVGGGAGAGGCVGVHGSGGSDGSGGGGVWDCVDAWNLRWTLTWSLTVHSCVMLTDNKIVHE